MLWWLVGLWLLSPALLLIFWLLGLLTSSSRSGLSQSTDAKTPGVVTTFAESVRPMACSRTRGSQAHPPVANS
jgi:hypothetical protein